MVIIKILECLPLSVFAYTALSKEGRRTSGTLSADTRAQLSVALVRVSGTIIGFRGATAIVVARRADLRLSQ